MLLGTERVNIKYLKGLEPQHGAWTHLCHPDILIPRYTCIAQRCDWCIVRAHRNKAPFLVVSLDLTEFLRIQEAKSYMTNDFQSNLTQTLPCHYLQHSIRGLVDSLCRDDADMPMPPYIRKAYNRPNAAFVSLFR